MDVLYRGMPQSGEHPCRCIAGGLLLGLLPPLAHAADLAGLQVTETDGVYSISLVMQLQAPAQQVHRVLTDYARIYRLNPAIVESEILPAPDDGVVRVRTRLRDCVAFFCREIDQVEDVRELGTGELQATTVPALSSFRSGAASWEVLGQGDHSQVSYQAEMEPDFYIPPLVGTFVVKQKLRQNTLASLARIECIARIQAGLERDADPESPGSADDDLARHAVAAALQTGADASVITAAPAAGRPGGAADGCDRPCAAHDSRCRP